MRPEAVNFSPAISLLAVYNALCHELEIGSQLPRIVFPFPQDHELLHWEIFESIIHLVISSNPEASFGGVIYRWKDLSKLLLTDTLMKFFSLKLMRETSLKTRHCKIQF